MTVPQIISNPKRQVRVDQCIREMARQGIEDYKLWPSVHIANKPTRTGISRAHKQIVQWALVEDMDEVTIFEDDIWFPAEDGWKYYLDNKPKEPYDLYLGGVYRGDIDEDGRISRYTGQYCYTITNRFFTTFLSVNEDLDIDGAMSGLGVFYVCNPFAAVCKPLWSDNANGPMDHSHLLIGRDINGFGVVKNADDAKRLSVTSLK